MKLDLDDSKNKSQGDGFSHAAQGSRAGTSQAGQGSSVVTCPRACGPRCERGRPSCPQGQERNLREQRTRPGATETMPVALCVCRDSEAAEGRAAALSPATGQGRMLQGRDGEERPGQALDTCARDVTCRVRVGLFHPPPACRSPVQPTASSDLCIPSAIHPGCPARLLS